jgi:hypothetical protein
VLRKIAAVAAACFALVACGQGEYIPQSAGEVVAIVTDELGFPNATALDHTLVTDEQGVLNLEIQVQVGINRTADDVLAANCTAIVFWHRNSPEGFLATEGGFLMEDPTNDKIFDSTDERLAGFKDCWQA